MSNLALHFKERHQTYLLSILLVAVGGNLTVGALSKTQAGEVQELITHSVDSHSRVPHKGSVLTTDIHYLSATVTDLATTVKELSNVVTELRVEVALIKRN